MKIRDIKLRPVHCAAPEATLTEVAAIMRQDGVGAVPVCIGDRWQGLVTDRNIAISCIANNHLGSKCLAMDYMVTNPPPVTPDTDVEEAARTMAVEKVNYLPVVENGRLAGIVSLGDIARVLKNNDSLVAETVRRLYANE